ncbi:MAG: hypothetical protein J0H43_01245, partial [Actinobacteria bacterium]|nr:hypothetical protein [Actinomycetota bacterium]
MVLGELSDLPWADGVTYLGWDGGLLLPTLLAPSFPSDLLRRALHSEPDELIVVLPQTVLRAP